MTLTTAIGRMAPGSTNSSVDSYPRIRCITSAAAGTARTARFGQVQAWNLTALGLTDIA